MLDIDQIINELIQMRETAGSQRGVAKTAGLNYGKIQRLEKSISRGIKVVDMARLLQAYGSSMAVYFGQRATLEELNALKESAELVGLFRRAVMNPEKRVALDGFLKFLFPAPKRHGKRKK